MRSCGASDEVPAFGVIAPVAFNGHPKIGTTVHILIGRRLSIANKTLNVIVMFPIVL